jgi:acetate CoA/acetoacetate CoA-transferase beta subunit
VERCTLPLTAAGVVKRLYTDIAVFAFEGPQPIVQDLAPGVDLNDLAERLGLSLVPSASGIGRYG